MFVLRRSHALVGVLLVPLALGTSCILFENIDDLPHRSVDAGLGDDGANEDANEVIIYDSTGTEDGGSDDDTLGPIDSADTAAVLDTGLDSLGETIVDTAPETSTDMGVDGDTGVDVPVDTGPTCPSGMVMIPGGTYTPAGIPDAGSTTLAAICMDQTEVTAGAYAACVASGKCSAPTTSCNYGVSGRELHPMNCLSFTSADNYCVQQGKRLPTPAEWEWAARGASAANTYPWGATVPGPADSPERLCWSGKSVRSSTCAVGSFALGDSLGGLKDLAGNVGEMTAGGGSYARGGSFDESLAANVSVTARRTFASLDNAYTGFRCVKNF